MRDIFSLGAPVKGTDVYKASRFERVSCFKKETVSGFKKETKFVPWLKNARIQGQSKIGFSKDFTPLSQILQLRMFCSLSLVNNYWQIIYYSQERKD